METVRSGAGALTDRELWARAAGGDTAAFELIYRRHVDEIHAYCQRRCAIGSGIEDADDVVALVFLESWRRRREVEMTHDSALPWLYGVARLVLLGRARRQSAHGMLDESALAIADPDHADRVVTRIDAARRLRRIRAAMAQLEEIDRDILLLCVWQQLDYRQAAQALGVPVGTVRSRLSRARARLTHLLNAMESGDTEVPA